MNFSLITRPTKEQFIKLEIDLKAEFESFRSGFYSHWKEILNTFESNGLVLFELNTKLVGFAAIEYKEITSKIDFFQILKPFEDNGYGSLFCALLLDHLKKENYKATSLVAIWGSETFWKKQGFDPFEGDKLNIEPHSYYKILVDCAFPVQNSESLNRVEIWDTLFYRDGSLPTWTFETNKKFKPILLPVHNEWKIRWTKNGIVEFDFIIKRFTRITEIDYFPFVYIEKLPE